MKQFFKTFLYFTSVITTAVVGVMSLICAMGGFAWELSAYILPQILSVGAATALTSTLFSLIPQTESKGVFFLVNALEYVCICAEMALFGRFYNWMTMRELAVMPLYVLIVYAIVLIVTYIVTKKEADKMTEAIRQRKAEN